MMHRVPFVLRRVERQQRKVGHPEKVERLGAFGQLLDLGDAQPQTPEHFAGDFPFVGGEEDQIAFLDLQLRRQRCFLRLR